MIIKDDKLNVKTNLSGLSSFKIAASSTAFRILSQNLYSNIYESIVREISSNGVDATVQKWGNNEKPLFVTLPTYFSDIFSVRDYGCSMTHEKVMDLYSTLFMSDKRETNSQIGSFGLGKLSVLGYVDVFTLTCFLNGETRVYSCFYGENGIPQIVLVSKEKSSEEDGTEVKFSVKQSDKHKFVDACKKIYHYYEVKPVIKGEQIRFEQEQKLLESKDWYVHTTNSWTGNALTIICGGIAYPTTFTFQNYGVVVKVPIGSVSFTASRESIEYTPSTTAFLHDLKNKIDLEIKEEFSKKLVHCKNVWEACLFCQDVGIWGDWGGINLQKYNFKRVGFEAKIVGSKWSNFSIYPVEAEFFHWTSKLSRIKVYADSVKINCYLVKFAKEEDKTDFEKESGKKVRDQKDLTKTYVKKNKPQQFFKLINHQTFSQAWEKCDKIEDGCYVELNGCDHVGFGTYQNFLQIVKALRELGYINNIYAIRSKSVKKAGLGHIDSVIDNLLKDNDKYNKYGRPYQYAYYEKFIVHKSKIPVLSDILNDVKFVATNKKKIQAYQALLNYKGIEIPESNVREKFNLTMKKYPVLDFIINNCASIESLDIRHVTDYCEMIDEKNNP